MALSLLARSLQAGLVVLELRRRSDAKLCGALLLTKIGSGPVAWHAHSFFNSVESRESFGGYLLFDQAIELLGSAPIWWGGRPDGSASDGVFRFKQRFSNATAPAHLLSVDLQPEALVRVRASRRRSST